ncbi:hypothetical protein [Sphingomonas sp. DBB INV C78]|uniref:hypothetical protein n=1 Tax=Sphingomonas sp. DBB INV C78 TaxID=3349434 RepID=UPI0036D4110D
MLVRSALLLSTLALAAPALAQASDAPAPAGEIISLSPDEKEKALDSGRGVHVGPAIGELPISGLPQVHGELGFMIGTGGMRGAYGTAAMPLGENAGATISFENYRWGHKR